MTAAFFPVTILVFQRLYFHLLLKRYETNGSLRAFDALCKLDPCHQLLMLFYSSKQSSKYTYKLFMPTAYSPANSYYTLKAKPKQKLQYFILRSCYNIHLLIKKSQLSFNYLIQVWLIESVYQITDYLHLEQHIENRQRNCLNREIFLFLCVEHSIFFQTSY